jgi:hypothetical protein
VKERAEQWAGAGHNSAVLVCCEGKCLGVRASAVCAAFRGVAPAASAAAAAEVFEVMPYASMGLLALAACLGMENHSNSHCIWCRCTAAQLKAIPNDQRAVTVTYPLRTPESQAEDLAATMVAKAEAAAVLQNSSAAFKEADSGQLTAVLREIRRSGPGFFLGRLCFPKKKASRVRTPCTHPAVHF